VRIPSRRISVIFVSFIVSVLFILNGCSVEKPEGFAIYLTEGDISPAQMPALSHVDIAEMPVIALNDIIEYDARKHEMQLTAAAYEDICQLDVPVSGRSFVVCVDRKPVYWGAFWTPISSLAFDGITIWQPLGRAEPHVISLELGYPASSFYGGDDPRSDPEVIRSLERSGKLIPGLSATPVLELPHSMKGYELYSWSEDGQWHFTLITGTNRTKTLEEITSGEDVISETGWVRIRVKGADAIKDILCRLPQDESVSWCDEMHIGQSTGTDFQLPPEPITDSIVEYAAGCGLDLMVRVP